MARRVWKWTEHQLDKLNKVKKVLEDLENYKPLTLRQVYYQLVGAGYIENNVSQYGMLSKLLKHARLDGYISWNDIEDRVRAYHDLTGWNNSDQYLNFEIKYFLDSYQRSLVQNQNSYIEIWIEKDALSSIFTKVANLYTIPVVVCRGFSSMSFLNDYKQRLLNYYSNKNPILLYFGDFDPSGVEMLRAMETTLRDELQVEGINFNRVALKKKHIVEYNLPNSPGALKKSDTRAKKHIINYGELAVELDALSPAVLEQLIKDSIENELDMTKYNFEKAQNEKEVHNLNTLKQEVTHFLNQK